MKTSIISANSLIEVKNEVATVSHITIAENVNYQPITVRKLIDKQIKALEEFGKVSFEMTKTTGQASGQGRNSKIYFLNEGQSTLLLTMLKNTAEIVKFKIALVKAFFELRNNQPKKSSTQEKRQIEDLRLHLKNKDREIIELKRAINRLTYNQSKGFSSGEQTSLEVTSNNNLAYVSQLENQNKEFLNYIKILYKKIEDIKSFAFTVFNKSCISSFFEIDDTRLKQLVGAKA
jgi:phage regulator Rha-like protein